MSPLITFNNCGISSSDVFLINLPTAVSRSASSNKFPEASLLSFIVLNLISLKILPFLPGRGWMKKGFPEFATASNTVIMKNTGVRTTSPVKLTIKSINDFKKNRYRITQVKKLPFRFQLNIFQPTTPGRNSVLRNDNHSLLPPEGAQKYLNTPG